MGTQLAAVQDVLLVFDLNVFLSRFDHRTVRVRARQTFVQIWVTRVILQFSGYFKGCPLSSRWKIRSEKFGQPQVGIF